MDLSCCSSAFPPIVNDPDPRRELIAKSCSSSMQKYARARDTVNFVPDHAELRGLAQR